MGRRTDLHSVLIIGSGPIVIGQACEFDYSGTQACKALRAEGLRVILVNSNPATIMTDPELTDATYIEPVTPEVIAKVIERERPDACLPTLGGQTALNAAMQLAESGVLEAYGVELIGADTQAIRTAEDRRLFRSAMEEIGMDLPRSGFAYTADEVRAVAGAIGLPVVVRGSFVLGGGGSGIAHTPHELDRIAAEALAASPISEVLVEESIEGWKEYELEVMRDRKDNYVVVCSIENLDPMGVHTGDSITVAPAQTLSDAEYQAMRDAGAAIIRRIGVETGGSNIQFAIDPRSGRMVVIEMNPRVSRSSALASKATGFPIAKIAAKLAIGYTLDEIANDITRATPACFEPSIDYVVVKIPRWAFEKFPDADRRLGTQMKSVGEAMAIGRTFPEALQKAVRSLENGRHGLGHDRAGEPVESLGRAELLARAAVPTEDRLFLVERALRIGVSVAELQAATGIDPWFLAQLDQLVRLAGTLAGGEPPDRLVRRAKRAGYSDVQLGVLTGTDAAAVRERRTAAGVRPTFKTVDTCAAEFEALTPYYYSTYEDEDEAPASPRESVVILGSGPNRIGQGIEFDYCCVHAALAIREAGLDAVMVNCNPETVSTDYDTSTRLYFEPLTLEDVLAIVERERPRGVIVTLGGQTPLKLAVPLEAAGVPVLGTQPDAIDRAEDRGRFTELLSALGIAQAPGGMATSLDEALAVVGRIGYPALVRPSYVLGGRAMVIVYDDADLSSYIAHAVQVSPEHPVLIDQFLEDATEVDVDAVCDGTDVYVGGILEHIEEAGVHSGDSASVLPPHSLAQSMVADLVSATERLALALGVRGLINAQFAVKDGVAYCLEVNPRASRTVPFIGKATGVPLAKVAVRVMLGEPLDGMDCLPPRPADGPWWGHDGVGHVAVKEAVLPFGRFPGVDTLLGPEMRSTGEVMGIDEGLGLAFAKSQAAAGWPVPTKGTVFISVADADKPAIIEPAAALAELGFEILTTAGTAAALAEAGVRARPVRKFSEGPPHIVEQILEGDIDLIINTPRGRGPRADGYEIRSAAVRRNIPYVTTISGARAVVAGIVALRRGGMGVRPVQDYLGEVARRRATRAGAATGPRVAGVAP
ncbi:MAG TPA: carbamoyl-phosphate synthase large subunit [Actinomycetota bacterium]|nr:carbamoyl-phosphate synthase large subunit [Actinomycetota bacterium]